MDLLSFLDQRERNHVLIIRRVLMNGGKMTVSELEKNFDLTYNTLVTYLEEIEETSQALGGGVCVTATINTLTIELADDVPISVLVDHYYKQALNIRLIKLIAFSKGMTKPLLSQKLAISESSVQRRVNHINRQIAEFEIAIRAHRFVGPELQIRYFLYRVFSKVPLLTIPTGAHSVERLAHIVQKEIVGYTDFTLLFPVTLWMHIAHEREGFIGINQLNLDLNHVEAIKQDILYHKIKKIYLSFYNPHSSYNDESEYIYLYLFLVSMGIFDLADNWVQKMMRGKWALDDLVADINKRTFQTLAACFPSLSEHTVFYDHIKYQLLQTHLQLLLFNGFSIYFDNQTFEQKKINYMDAYVDRIAEDLLAQTFDAIDKEFSNEVWQLTYYRYQSIVYELVLEEQRPLLVGLDFRLNYILQTNIMQRLTRFLEVNVDLTKAKPGGKYDLVITNYQPENTAYDSLYFYRIAEFETEYDRERIMHLLEKASLKRQNKPKL